MCERDQNELDSILSDALELRRQQDAIHKRHFESLPDCVQKSLFQPQKEKGVDSANELLEEATELFQQKQVIQALTKYESALACVWYVELRPQAPHWRDKGVRDEWILVKRLDDLLATHILVKIVSCLFKLKMYGECQECCDQTLKHIGRTKHDNLAQSSAIAYSYRARCKLQLKRNRDFEESALRDLVQANKLHPDDEETQMLMTNLETSIRRSRAKVDDAFKGAFLKNPGLLSNETDSDGVEKAIQAKYGREALEEATQISSKGMKVVRQREAKAAQEVRTELDGVELEAARLAGLDVSDPTIRQILLRLSTEEGRELFDKEEERLEKLEQHNQAIRWLAIILIAAILFSGLIYQFLKSISIDKPHQGFGSVERVRRIRKQISPTPEL